MLIIRSNANVKRMFPLPAEIVGDCDSPWLAIAKSPLLWFAQPSLPGLIWLHRTALVSEIEGRWLRATFYWKEFDADLAKLSKHPGGLGVEVMALARAISAPVPSDVDEARGRFVDELIIDVHAALYNSLTEDCRAEAKARSQYHLCRLKARLPDSGLTPPERAALLRPVVRAEARSAEASARWPDAVAQYRDLLDANPADMEAQDGMMRALWEQVISELGSDSSEVSARREAAAILPIIREMDSLADRLLYHADLYDILAQSHLIHAVRLANSGELAEALASIEKALATRPGWDEAEAVGKQLKEMMEALQASVATIEAQLNASPNATLNAEGLRLRNQARTGFGPAQCFAASERANQHRMYSERARARRLWIQLGLAEPDGDWNEQAQLLANALGNILMQPPKTPEAIEACWDVVSAVEPRLAVLDRQKIGRFLEHRLLGRPWQAAESPAPVDESVDEEPLTIPLTSCERKIGGAPFGDWLRSSQDRGLKARLVLAAVAVFAASGFAAREQTLLAQRDRAYSVVAEASRRQDDIAAMEAAAEFLSARPFAADSRKAEVVSAYQRAFVHWIAELQGDFKPVHQPIVDRYRQLVSEGQHL
jgi:hypothetical protein